MTKQTNRKPGATAAASALAVGHLADRLRGAPAFVQRWPRDDRPLTTSARKELQTLLGLRGFAVGEPDGRLGPKTRDRGSSLPKLGRSHPGRVR